MRPILKPPAATLVAQWHAQTGDTPPALVSAAILAYGPTAPVVAPEVARVHGVGPRLRALRARLALTQGEVAHLVGISQQRVSQVERGAPACYALVEWVDARLAEEARCAR